MRHVVVAFAALLLLACAGLEAFDSAPPLPLVTAAHAATLPNAAEAPKPSTAPVSLPSPYMLDAATLAYVDCDKYMGSAVHLGGGRYITAAHVASATGCKIGGKPVTIEAISISGDWAIIRSDAHLPFYAITSCGRLVEGQVYFASGYAEGNPWPVTIRLVAERYRDNAGISWLRGSIVSGMSGGSVVDSDGVVHAINDMRLGDGVPLGGVVELADTPLCKKGSK